MFLHGGFDRGKGKVSEIKDLGRRENGAKATQDVMTWWIFFGVAKEDRLA